MSEAVIPVLFFQQKFYQAKIRSLEEQISKLHAKLGRSQAGALMTSTWLDFTCALDQMPMQDAMNQAIGKLSSTKSIRLQSKVIDVMRDRLSRQDNARLFDVLENAVEKFEL